MASIVLNGDTSGSVTLSPPAVAGTNIATLPAATGTVMVSGNMPAFSAYRNGSQSVSVATWTKVQFNTEDFDTNNCFDSTTNYRFTPTVAGYYIITAGIGFDQSVGSSSYTLTSIYKNGSAYKTSKNNFTSPIMGDPILGVSSVIYFNGSTDYVEVYGIFNPTSGATFQSGNTATYFTGAMIRA